MKIALIDKAYNNTNYKKHYNLDLDVYHMSSGKLTGRLLKKDIDLGTTDNPINIEEYDYVILVGAEAALKYANKKGLMDYSGKRVEHNGYSNFIISISPAMLHFKPELKPTFENTVECITRIIAGNEIKPKAGDYKPITDKAEAIEYLNFVYNMCTETALDSETSGLYSRDCYLLGISVSHQEYQGVYIHADVIDDEVCEILQKVVNKNTIIFHNLKFDMHMYTYHLGISFAEPYRKMCLHDTMLQHYVLDERKATHGLKQLAMKYTDMGDYDYELDLFKKTYCKQHGIKEKEFTYDLIPFDIMWQYAARDTCGTIRLHHKFLPLIENNKQLSSLYYNILIPATMFLQRVENRGVPLSKARLKAANVYLNNKLQNSYKKLYDFKEVLQYEQDKGDKFNPNSPQQMRVLLFDYLRLTPTGKLTETGAISTDAEVLEQLASQHPIARTLLDIRKTAKLISTYIEKLLCNIDMDGRIRTNFNLQTTTSGRLSSSGKINLQQLPRDDSIIKACVVVPKGYKLVSLDW